MYLKCFKQTDILNIDNILVTKRQLIISLSFSSFNFLQHSVFYQLFLFLSLSHVLPFCRLYYSFIFPSWSASFFSGFFDRFSFLCFRLSISISLLFCCCFFASLCFSFLSFCYFFISFFLFLLVCPFVLFFYICLFVFVTLSFFPSNSAYFPICFFFILLVK